MIAILVHDMPCIHLNHPSYGQTSQLSRFGRETHDFLTDLTIACQSHDFSQFSRNVIIIVRLIRYKCHVIPMLPCPGS